MTPQAAAWLHCSRLRASAVLLSMLFAVAIPQQVASQSATCLATTAASITQSCFNSTSAQQHQSCAVGVMQSSVPCCEAAPAGNTTTQSIRLLVPQLVMHPAVLDRWAQGFKAASGIDVTFTPIPVPTYMQEILYELKANATGMSHAGYLLAAPMVAPTADAGGLLDLTPYVKADEQLAWTDISAFFREVSSVYDRKIVTIPLDGDMLLMYYRKDVLAKHNVTAPVTWGDFMELAARFNGTDLDGDGQPDHSVCIERAPMCTNPFWVTMMAASMIQYRGTSHGTFVDPSTMVPLANNVAMQQAMEWFKTMGLYTHPNASECLSTPSRFAQGRCLLSAGFADHFKVSQLGNGTRVRDALGVALLPGSTHVLNRTSGQLVPCTQKLCPFATQERLQDGSVALVNRSPYSALGGMIGGVSSLVSKQEQDAAYKFWSYLASPQVSLETVMDAGPAAPFDPFRYSHVNPAPWIQKGYEATAATLYLDATKLAVNSPNCVLELTMPAPEYGMVVRQAIDMYLVDAINISTALGMIQDSLVKAINANPPAVTRLYRSSLGWQPPEVEPGAGVASQKQTSDDNLAVIIAPVVVCSAFVLLIALLVVAYKLRDKRKTMFGKVKAPGAGPDTTLVVTDIQDSTALWELLTPAVMDAALKQHHQVIRQLLVVNSGYESATEGDSFIMAFHSAKDAVNFAVQLQHTLLEATWPDALLATPVCEPVRVVPNARQQECVDVLAAQKSMLSEFKEPSNERLESVGSLTYKAMLLSAAQTVDPTLTEGVLVFRGLRVRVGCHTGISDPALVVCNSSVQRTQYAGEAIMTAKAVCDAAHGAMILLSGATYRMLRMEDLGQQVVLLQCGSHYLKAVPEACDLYQAASSTLAPRLPYLGPLRTLRALDVGAMDAPAGTVSIVFLYIVGAQSLLAWNTEVARQSIAMVHQLVADNLAKQGGYMVEETDDLVLASFANAEHAALTLLAVLSKALHLDWPPELLEHPLGEELALMSSNASCTTGPLPRGAPRQMAAEYLLRGLRLKAGVDTGPASATPHTTTGRIAYRGRVMNRAARIASTAGSGQVLASATTFQALPEGTSVDAAFIGDFQLKGVAGMVGLYQLSLPAGRSTGSLSGKGRSSSSSEARLVNTRGLNRLNSGSGQPPADREDWPEALSVPDATASEVELYHIKAEAASLQE